MIYVCTEEEALVMLSSMKKNQTPKYGALMNGQWYFIACWPPWSRRSPVALSVLKTYIMYSRSRWKETVY